MRIVHAARAGTSRAAVEAVARGGRARRWAVRAPARGLSPARHAHPRIPRIPRIPLIPLVPRNPLVTLVTLVTPVTLVTLVTTARIRPRAA
ncbi:hypothetical protein DIE16_27860 [Burkholderia sp. Bp9090]|nr:hypothetical protein DIE16_27860 [Burkholderia sp. Bp9090]